MTRSINNLGCLLCLVLLLQLPSHALGRAPEEAEFYAAGAMGERIGNWVSAIEPKPASVGIFYVHSNAPLDQDYSGIVETEIMKSLTQNGINKVFSCTECRAAQVSVENEKVVISKAIPDLETFKRLGQGYGTEVFLVVDILRTKLNVVAQTVVYQNNTGIVVAAERFTVPAISFTDSSVQVLATFGLGQVLASSSGSTTSLSTAANLMLLEEVGFGKAGLDSGAVLGSGTGTLIYINPTLAFRGHFGTSGLGWSLMLGTGYGFVGSAKGLSTRLGWEVYFGQLAVFGIEADYLLTEGTTPTLPGYAGFHVGIALGR